MTRWIITAIAVGAISALTAAPGCASTGVGDPCTPDEEYTATFQGFSVSDVSVESKSYVCLSRLCLVNHFQGRVTCPYGQSSAGTGPCVTESGAGPCTALPPGTALSAVATAANAAQGCSLPGTGGTMSPSPVTARDVSVGGYTSGQVPAQLVGLGTSDRTANKAVYCSCHCANTAGQTNDGQNYCTCPSNYSCTQLVTSITAGMDEGLTGAYCVLNGTAYDPGTSSSSEPCSATETDTTAAGYCPAQY